MNEHVPTAGQLLRTYRDRAGLRQADLADAVGVFQPSIYQWEKGKAAIPSYRVGSLAENLALSDEEAQQFILAVNPDFAKTAGIEWLKKRILTKDWNAINFPALEGEWLATHGDELKGGLLLKAYRHRRNYSQPELANLIGTSKEVIEKVELGYSTDSYLHTRKFGALARELKLTSEEAVEFAKYFQPQLLAVGNAWLERQVHEKNWQALDIPALEPYWLERQPKSAQPRLLLEAYCTRETISDAEFARKMKMSITAVKDWMIGERSLPADKLGTMISQLSLSEQEAEKLVKLANPDITNKVSASWLGKQIHAREWKYINFPALDIEWLQAQPAENRLGLLLKAYRDRIRLPQYAGIISEATVSNTEHGISNMSEKNLDKYSTTLKLLPEERYYLIRIASQTREARKMDCTTIAIGCTKLIRRRSMKEIASTETMR